MNTDYGAPKRRKKSDSGSNKLAIKVKGEPQQVHKVLDRIAGAGDRPMPGLRGPRHLHPTPAKMESKSAPALARPLGAVGGKAPRLKAESMGVGDPPSKGPAPLRGGAQPVVSMTRVAVYKRTRDPLGPVKSNNPEGRKGHSMGPKQIKPSGKVLNPNVTLRFPEAEPPKAGRVPRINTSMPEGAEPRRAPEPKLISLKIRKAPALEEEMKPGRKRR